MQDGTLAAHHKVLDRARRVNYLEPKVIAALEQFITGGGAVIVTDDSEVQIKGATKLGVPADNTSLRTSTNSGATRRKTNAANSTSPGNFLKAAEPVARALAAKLRALGIAPALDCDAPGDCHLPRSARRCRVSLRRQRDV